MTIWKPDTCHCVADVENKNILINCKTHKVWTALLNHHQAFNRRPQATEQQREALTKSKADEKAKAQFQRE